MADNQDDKKRFVYSGERAVLAAMLVLLILLIVIMVKAMHDLPAGHAAQSVPVKVPQSAPAIAAPEAASDTQDVPVGFRVSGRVAQMLFADHAQVKRGDVLATLDKAPFEEALAYAKAQLQLAQAELSKPSHLSPDSFNAIEAARANVETAQHTYDAAHAELEKRRQYITATAGQPDNVYNDDVQDEHDAELNLQRMRRELAQRQDEANTGADRDVAKAALQVAQANVAMAEANLADTQLTAPAGGVISGRGTEVGANVAAGAPVYTLSVPK